MTEKVNTSEIARRMRKTGITVAQLAKAIGIAPAELPAILRGESVTAETVNRIADVLGCDVPDLLSWSPDNRGGV